jgi:hypothetical protein
MVRHLEANVQSESGVLKPTLKPGGLQAQASSGLPIDAADNRRRLRPTP